MTTHALQMHPMLFLYISLTLMFIYCKHKSVVAKNTISFMLCSVKNYFHYILLNIHPTKKKFQMRTVHLNKIYF